MEVDVVTLAAEFPNDNPALHQGLCWVCLDVTGAPAPIADALPIVAPASAPAPVAELPSACSEAPIPEARISGIVTRGETPRVDDQPMDLEALAATTVEPIERVAVVEAVEPHLASEDDDTTIVVEELPPLDASVAVEGLDEVATAPATTLPPKPDDAFTVLVVTLADVALGAGSPSAAALLPGLLLDGVLSQPLTDEVVQALAGSDIASQDGVSTTFRARTLAWRAILLGTSDDFEACGGPMLDEWAADLLARLIGVPSRAPALRRDLRSHGIAAFGLVEAA